MGQKNSYASVLYNSYIDVMGIRFTPMGFSFFHSIPISSITNRGVQLKDLFGEEGENVEEQILSSRDMRKQIEIIRGWLKKKLRADVQKGDIDLLGTLVTLIRQSKGTIKIKHLSKRVGVSISFTEKKFLRYIGLTPKEYARLIRFEHVLSLKKDQNISLTELAHRAHYYDLSHLNKEVNKLTGISPKQLDKNSNHILYNFLNPEIRLL